MTERNREANYWRHARCGDHVYDVADPRHVGRLEAIHNTSTATVKFFATGWKRNDIAVRDLRKADPDMVIT